MMLPCSRYVDDTITAIRPDCITGLYNQTVKVVDKLNSFHKNIQYMYELECEIQITFLDVLLICNDEKVGTTFTESPHTATNTCTGIHSHQKGSEVAL